MFLDLNLFNDDFFSQTSYFQQIYNDLIYWGSFSSTNYIIENNFFKVRNKNDSLFPLTYNEIPSHNTPNRNYSTFFTLFEKLTLSQKERVTKTLKYLIGSMLQLQEWGAIYHAKLLDRHAWHYYIDTGTFVEEYPLPECSWMKSIKISEYKGKQTIEAKTERFNTTIRHLRNPDPTNMKFPSTKRFLSPKEFYFLPWSFDESNYLFDADHDLFELPFPHELGLTETNLEHSKKTYTLRNNVRKLVIEKDDNEVINCVFSHPDIQDSIPLLQFYMGLCEGEHERYFSYKTLKSIRSVACRGFGNFSLEEISKNLGTLTENSILPFHPTILEDVSHMIETNLSKIQRKRFLDINGNIGSINLRAIAKIRLTELLHTGKYSSPLKNFERLAIFVALLGEYAYQESYVLLSCNELYAVETMVSQITKSNNKNFSYSPNTTVAFPGSGALPLTAIFKHIMTDARIILIDKDSDALKKAKAFINWLVFFGIVKEGKIICADPCSAEEYFSPNKILKHFKEIEHSSEHFTHHHETSHKQSNTNFIDVVELAALLPDKIKYKIIDAISSLPQNMQPNVICCRTSYGKTLCIYEKTPALPFCLHYFCVGSTFPKNLSPKATSKDLDQIIYYNHQPRMYIFINPYLISSFPITKNISKQSLLKKALQEEAKKDSAYSYLYNIIFEPPFSSIPSPLENTLILPNQQTPSWAVRFRIKYIKHSHKHFHDDIYHMHEHYDNTEACNLHIHMHEHIHEN